RRGRGTARPRPARVGSLRHPRRAGRGALRGAAAARPGDTPRRPRPAPGLLEVIATDAGMEDRIRDHLAARMEAGDLRLGNVERIAVGWSHETWLFDASWTDEMGPRTQGFCLRRDPG